MLSDQLCATSWRARPRSFVSLMTLYESNYIRLGWVIPDLPRLPATAVATVPGEPPLEASVRERSRYTTTLELSCLFRDAGGLARDPRLAIRVYHDARLVEACAAAGGDAGTRPDDSRWSSNMLLNKWLEYCADRGYRFALAPA